MALECKLTDFQCHICDGSQYTDRGRREPYALHQCKECGTVVIDPLPTSDELAAAYTKYAMTASYQTRKHKKIRRSRRRLLRLRKYVTGNRVLDVGCNLGYTVAAALELGMDASGIDIDPDTIALAQREFGNDRFAAVTVEEFAERGETFDIVYTAETIEHSLNPHSFMAALAKLLNPGGLLYLTTPDAGHMRVPGVFSDWNEVDPPFHIYLMTKSALMLMLDRHGLSLVKFQINLKPGIRLLARKV